MYLVFFSWHFSAEDSLSSDLGGAVGPREDQAQDNQSWHAEHNCNLLRWGSVELFHVTQKEWHLWKTYIKNLSKCIIFKDAGSFPFRLNLDSIRQDSPFLKIKHKLKEVL